MQSLHGWLVHPAADIFPMMSDEELEELGADIKKNGMNSPIVGWVDPNGDPDDRGDKPLYMLDGRNRFKAASRAGLDLGALPFSDYEGDDPVGYVMSANLRRRHLTGSQKRDLIARLLKLAPERSNRQVAKDVGVDHKTVEPVRSKSEATGEIPQLNERVGADGRSRPTRAKPKAKPKPQKNARPQKAVPDPPAEPPSLESSSASREEKERYRLLKQGTTVVAHRTDKHLIEWAETAGLLVRIDRQSPWANPFLTPDDGDPKTVVEHYREHYLPHKPSLQKRLPDLRGKALACSCVQPPCHGYVLRDLAEAAPTTV